ncbi:MAG: MarR family winged helix-turn-helix transcriptional regulator [Myxococcota bacterium]
MARAKPHVVPLARLMAIAQRSLIDGLHAELAARRIDDVRPSYGYVMLAARKKPTSVTAIATLMGTTKQAASKLVDAMVLADLLERRAHASDARKHELALSARGHRVLATVEGIYQDLEARWVQILGRDRVEAMRHDLVTVLEATHDGTLPLVRPVP